jgi:hypothetical protein
MMRACVCAAIVVGAAIAVLCSRQTMPYPYPVAYKLGFDYRESSLKEEELHNRLLARHPMAIPGARAPVGVKLTKFYPRYPDTEVGAVDCWNDRRKTCPIIYREARSDRPRAPTDEDVKLEREGWVAGYLESARRHPAKN